MPPHPWNISSFRGMQKKTWDFLPLTNGKMMRWFGFDLMEGQILISISILDWTTLIFLKINERGGSTKVSPKITISRLLMEIKFQNISPTKFLKYLYWIKPLKIMEIKIQNISPTKFLKSLYGTKPLKTCTCMTWIVGFFFFFFFHETWAAHGQKMIMRPM